MKKMAVLDFAVNHQEAAALIAANGAKVSYVLEGSPGIGKSSVLHTMKGMLRDAYEYIYVDVPLKDIPDIALSMPDHATHTTMAYINKIWMGTDPLKPKIIMLDEIFKGSEYVKLMMNRLLLERAVGEYALPEGSIVFGTTNFQTDGVGDRTNGHTNSRISRVMMRQPSEDEWVTWATNNDVHSLVITWAKSNPDIFSSYKEREFNKAEHDNGQGIFHYIYHPQYNNAAYVCPRSLVLTSHQVHNMGITGEGLLTKALIGTVGAKAALDMTAMFSLGNELPDMKDVEKNPTKAKMPKSVSGQMMMVYKSMQFIDKQNLDAYITYFKRFPVEMLCTWVKTTMSNTKVKPIVLDNPQIHAFAKEYSWTL